MNQTTLRDDLLIGATAIAAHLGWKPRRIYHVAAERQLPIKQVGKLLIARKSELDRALSAAEQGGE